MRGQRQRNTKPYIRKIDFAFYHEKEIRAAVLDARNDLQTPSLRNGSGISDPTARDAIKNLTPIAAITINGVELKLPEYWLIVIEKSYSWCRKQSEVYFQAARRRYNGENYLKICRELNISQVTFSRIMEKVRMYAALQAVQMRLIYVE